MAERVGVYRVGHLGDTVVALPAMWNVRETFSEARVTLITARQYESSRPQVYDVIPPGTVYDELIAFPGRVSGGGAAGTLSRILQLRKARLEVLAYLPPPRSPTQLKRDRVFFRLCGIKRFFGLNDLALQRRGSRPSGPASFAVHEAEALLGRLERDGLARPSTPRADLGLTADELAEADRWFESNGFDRESATAAVAPNSKRTSNIWPIERFREVCGALDGLSEMQFVLVGGEADREVCAALAEGLRRAVNTAGSLTVRRSAAILSRVSMYLGLDAGPLHLCAAAGVPCVAIFSARNAPGQWFPYGEGHKVHRLPVPCEVCELDICDKGNICLMGISTEQVLRSCEQVLEVAGRVFSDGPNV